MSKRIVIITLMRKNTKRFPNKCIYKIYNKQLYKYTTDFAIKLNYDYYLAHDYDFLDLDKNIKEIKRNQKFTGDKHRTCEEIKSFNINADIYIFLQVTSPLRDINIIRKGINDFIFGNYDCGLTVYKLPVAFYYIDKKEINFNQINDRTDNGSFKKNIYVENGAFYIFKKKMLNKKHILDSNNKLFIIDKYNIDINTIEDIFMIYKILSSKRECNNENEN